MARPVKIRHVESFPAAVYFVPQGQEQCDLCEYVLKIEELEAIRLKDVEDLNQTECAERMGVSRPTFQNIVDSARKKVALALSTGAAIRISGGHYAARVCRMKCRGCGGTYAVNNEEDKQRCPHCGSDAVGCAKRAPKCRNWCWKQPEE